MNNNPTYFVWHLNSLLILIIVLLFNVVSIKANLYDLKMQLNRIESVQVAK